MPGGGGTAQKEKKSKEKRDAPLTERREVPQERMTRCTENIWMDRKKQVRKSNKGLEGLTRVKKGET